jgi:hypothetical protein
MLGPSQTQSVPYPELLKERCHNISNPVFFSSALESDSNILVLAVVFSIAI